MDELQGRFRRLDRVQAPSLWNEAVGRAAQLELAPRRAFSPGLGLLAATLLLAALAGTVAVGAWLNRTPPVRETVTYDNGMLTAVAGCGQLVHLDAGTSAARELTDGLCSSDFWRAGPPMWASDGSRAAWMDARWTESGGPMVYETSTGEVRQLEGCCYSIDISPDGSLIAYEFAFGLVVTAIDSGETHRVELPGGPLQPRFSPDGRQIAIPVLGGKSGVYLLDVGATGDLGDPTLLYGPVAANEASWSPDGEWIAVAQSGGFGMEAPDGGPSSQVTNPSGTGVVVVRSDGSEARVLATGPFDAGPRAPTWSPDSRWVAFLASSAGDGLGHRRSLEMWTVAIDGGEPTRIYDSGCWCAETGRPDWSPDGAWIAFGMDGGDTEAESGTFLIQPDGSGLRRISDMPLAPAWQPIPRD